MAPVTTQSNFLVRAASMPPGSMIHESGKVEADYINLNVETKDGRWQLAFYPKDVLADALKVLNGARVTCTYRKK